MTILITRYGEQNYLLEISLNYVSDRYDILEIENVSCVSIEF